MSESLEFVDKDTDKGKEIHGFIKKFTKITPKKAKELRKDLKEMDMLKMREEHIAKIIDIVPETEEELNKIFNDVGLDKDESKKILETTKKYK